MGNAGCEQKASELLSQGLTNRKAPGEWTPPSTESGERQINFEKEVLMWRKLMMIGAVAMLPTVAMAVPSAGDYELTLNGTGASDNDFDNHAIGADAQLGYYFSDPMEVYIRQSLSYADSDGS